MTEVRESECVREIDREEVGARARKRERVSERK